MNYINTEKLEQSFKTFKTKQLQEGFMDAFSLAILERFVEVMTYIQGDDVAPVVHSKWIRRKYPLSPYCAYCGANGEGGNYCGHCGAKMDLEEIDNENT